METGNFFCPLKKRNRIAILSTGFIGKNITDALESISHSDDFAHYDFSFVKPLDAELLHTIFTQFEIIITLEDGAKIGGFGAAIAEFKTAHNYSNTIQILGIPDEFIEHGTVDELQNYTKINTENIRLILLAYHK